MFSATTKTRRAIKSYTLYAGGYCGEEAEPQKNVFSQQKERILPWFHRSACHIWGCQCTVGFV